MLDTCFLIDLQRELRKRVVGRAGNFLQERAQVHFSISVISVTEFLEGFQHSVEGERFLRPYARVDVDSTVAAQAAIIRRDLRLRGNLIGDFDILIAATALCENIPLVTKNIDEFKRVAGLELVTY